MRSRRRTITPAARDAAARSFACIADRANLLRRGTRIAAYRPFGSEADTSQLIARAWQHGCAVFLPAVTSVQRMEMRFVRYRITTRLRRNAFGILEPDPAGNALLPPSQLDLIFMPLLAFDDSGARLGSGAGFYDRCLQHLHAEHRWRRPQLIGIGYELQHVAQLSSQHWDIPMDGIVTEQCLYRPHSTRTGAG